MRYLADLHIHSPYSRATSKESDLFGLSAWAAVKGIHLVASGDFTHPTWFNHLKENLAEAEPGFFRLKDPAGKTLEGMQPEAIDIRFVLSTEISSIYKRHGKVRKVHNLLYVPSFEDAARINARLAAIGNIESDGRPILGLDSRDLLEILLENSANGFLVPAHIWTPWFSLFGSKSGFDSVEECYGDLSRHIFALETGLSSDPDMNRLLSALDRFRLISNSDCHSPSKLGREANLFDTDFSFIGLRRALEKADDPGFAGTVEFFPEEGKYHFDGHRKCNVCLSPEESRELDNICPVCHKPLTIGVHNRVLELADRQRPVYPNADPGFHSLIPLPEILGEINERGPTSKRVQDHYRQAVNRFGSEFNILLNTPPEELAGHSSLLAEAVGRMRRGEVIRQPGFDGEFGVIRVFEKGELSRLRGQTALFAPSSQELAAKPKTTAPHKSNRSTAIGTGERTADGANPEQHEAIISSARNILVTAGPGTGKTFTLVRRLLHLLDSGKVLPQQAFLITFTNKAAEEIAQRLTDAIGDKASSIFVGTFHQFCLLWLHRKEPNLQVAGPNERAVLLRRLFPDIRPLERQAMAEEVNAYFMGWQEENQEGPLSAPVQRYLAALDDRDMLDLDGIIPFFLKRLQDDVVFGDQLAQAVGALLVDEFQDVNPAQFRLVCLLARRAATFAIGDPDQAIYGFRGSRPELFQQFAGLSFAGKQVTAVNLHRNYRNAGRILLAAQKLIDHNRDAHERALTPLSRDEALLEYHLAVSPEAEAQYIVQRLEEVVGGISHFSINSGRGGNGGRGLSFSDIGILIRLNTQAGVIRDALEKRGIPCQLVGLPPFFMKGDLRLVSFWILALANLAGIGEYLRLFAALPGVGHRSLDKLEDFALKGGDLFDFAHLSRLLPKQSRPALERFLAQLETWRKMRDCADLQQLASTGMALFDLTVQSAEAERFLQLAGSFGADLPAFARHLQRNAAATVYDDRAEAVSLLTIHGSKGLEFDTIFIAGLEEGVLPHNFGEKSCDLEEERRLLYVGITRARRQLILTGCRQRSLHGKAVELPPSRFLDELPSNLLKTGRQLAGRAKKRPAKQLSLF